METTPAKRDSMFGSALTNANVEAFIAKARARIADSEREIAQLSDLLRARADDKPEGWSEPAPRYNPASPEPPAVAAEILSRIS